MPNHSPLQTRRQFLSDSAALTAGAVIAPLISTALEPEFHGKWSGDPDRPWLGPEFWANPLQDWQVKDGRAECIAAKANRNVHVLTRELADRPGELFMSVRIGRVGGGAFVGDGKGSAGFKIGILGTLRDYPDLRDYRNNLAFSSGWDAGITAAGDLFFGDVRQPAAKANIGTAESIQLELRVSPGSGGAHVLKLLAKDGASEAVLGELTRDDIRPNQLIGNLAIGCNFGPEAGPRQGKKKISDAGPGPGAGMFWFSDWTISGGKVDAHPGHSFGPILFNHYTLSGGIMKMSVQMPPLGARDATEVELRTLQDGAWRKLASAHIDPLSRNAVFRIENWDDSKDTEYQLAYPLLGTPAATEHTYSGVIRRDPTEKDELSVADVSCNIHTAFPNAPYVAKVAALNPDMLAFVGDQFYESTAGYGVQRSPLEPATLDYLRKWYFHGWTWRDLTKDRPSVCIPDDHDVYQGNLWGEGGEPQTRSQEAGGYEMPATWVNVVHRTQTAHQPDPYDPLPSKQGITNYYGSLTYGGVSFAILADRQFKSAPEGKVPPTDERADHVINPGFDPKTADVPGLELLGGKQMEFLRAWVRQWNGARMKAVISQTIFAGMATTHGAERQVLRADYDQNGWPQAARNAALREIRKAFAFHLAGDQHLPAVIHYGIETHGDAGAAFAGPAVNTGYPRWWEPTAQVHARKDGQGVTGKFVDHFGHPMTVRAVHSPAARPRQPVIQNLSDKASGFGLVRFNKNDRTIVCDCWPFAGKFTPDAPQFEGWPVKFEQKEMYGRSAVAFLPTLNFKGSPQPLVEVLDANGELVYAVRPGAPDFQPHAFSPGSYSVRVSDPETGRAKDLRDLQASPRNDLRLEIELT